MRAISAAPAALLRSSRVLVIWLCVGIKAEHAEALLKVDHLAPARTGDLLLEVVELRGEEVGDALGGIGAGLKRAEAILLDELIDDVGG